MFNAIIENIDLRDFFLSGTQFTWGNLRENQPMRSLIESWQVSHGKISFF
jgi:hypothetical protein